MGKRHLNKADSAFPGGPVELDPTCCKYKIAHAAMKSEDCMCQPNM